MEVVLGAIGAWLASGLIGGLWAKRKGDDTDTNIRDAPPAHDLTGAVGGRELGETSPIFTAMLSGPFALYNAWKQQRHSK